MKLEDIQDEAQRDAVVDPCQLDAESIKIPLMHNKYLKMMTNAVLRLKALELKKKEVTTQKWLYYSGKAPEEVYKNKPFDLKLMKHDVEKFIESDKEIIEIDTRIELLTQTINFLQETLKQINNRHWTIKNAIEWKKFVAGK